MFEQRLSTTPLTNTDANAYFEPRISGSDWLGDTTMLAVLRALLDRRLGENEAFGMIVYSSTSAIGGGSDVLRRGLRNYSNLEMSNTLTIVDISGDRVKTEQCIESLVTLFPSTYDGWTELSKIRGYFKRNFPCVCFIDTTNKRCVVFVQNLTAIRFHFLAMSVPALISWYFAGGMNETEKALLCALDKRDSAEFLEILQKIADTYDFRSSFIRSQLAGLETRALRERKRELENNISENRDQIRSYDNSIGNLLTQINKMEIELAGVFAKLSQGETSTEDSPIMRFFMENPHIKLISCRDDRLDFICSGVLSEWDEDAAEDCINYEYSMLYNDTSEMSAEQIKRLLTAIFIDRTLKLHVVGAYGFQFPTRVYAVAASKDVQEFKDCYPNPHIQQYHCMDGYIRVVNSYLQRHNYIAAIETCVASCCSVNWNDATVMDYFARTFLRKKDGWNRRAIELPTGEIVEPKEAVAWLEAQNEQKETEE